MNICPKCGVTNPPFNDVCRSCDAPLTAGAAAVSAPAIEQEILEVKPFVAEPAKPPPAPGWLRIFGVLSILMGIGVPIANYFMIKDGIDKFLDEGFSDNVVLPLWITIWLFVGIGAYMVVSGLGLLGPTRWGRVLSMVFIALAMIGVITALVNGVITKVLAEEEFQRMHANSYFAVLNIRYYAAAPFFPPAYAALMLVMMILPQVRDWARGRTEVRSEIVSTSTVSSQQPQVHGPAMMSMVLSMVPFLLITQIVSFIMGIGAIRAINRSEGKLTGKGFAWTGIIISSLILGCMGSIIGVAATAALFMPQNAEERRGNSPYYDKYENRRDEGAPAKTDVFDR
jgi:hypothetical protein